MINSIYNKGYNAFNQSQGQATNPYSFNTKDYNLWNLGFNNAEKHYFDHLKK